MKNIPLLIILLCLTFSCNFLRKVETRKIPSESNPQNYDGTYKNSIDQHNALWPMLTNNKSKDSTGTITIRTLDKNTLLISHSRISSRYHSYIIKGKLKKGGFQFRRRRKFLGFILVVWGYRCTTFTLKNSSNGETILSEHDYSMGGMIFPIPMAGNNSTQDHVLKKVSDIQ